MESVELTKEQILNADDIKIERVETPEWGGYVFVSTLSAEEGYRYSRNNIDDDGNVKDRNVIVEYCVAVMCNSKGERIFTKDDVDKLCKKSATPLVRVYEAARKLNGEDIGELEKNSNETRSENSDSD